MRFPIIAVNRRYRYPTCFGRVDKMTFSQIYTDMAGVVGWFKENKIANAHVLECDWMAFFHLPDSGAWKIDVESISVHRLNETRAIDTVAVISTQVMLGAQPTAIFFPKLIFEAWNIRA